MNTLFNINVCRVCLQSDQNYDFSDKDLLEKFEYTTRIQISKEDNLPKTICSNCSKKLKVAFNFIKTAHESEKSLQKFMEKICSEFKVVAQQKKSDTFLNEGNISEDDLLSLLDEGNREGIETDASVIDTDNCKKEIECSFSKDILLMRVSKNVDSVCENNSHLVEINTQENDAKKSCNEEAEDNNEISNSQTYANLNSLESNEEYDVRSQSDEFAIEESEENHDYDMIINTQDDSTQCQSVNNEESLSQETNQYYDDININNLKEESENQLQDDEYEQNKIPTSSKSGNVDNRFYCDKCNRDFSTKTNLNRHMQSHEGNKPFSCTKCTKSFTQKSTLKQHMYTHTGERPYVCEVCNRGFTQHTSLLFHMRRHTGEKPFHCEYCLITFRQKDALRIHILKHHVVIERDMDGFETFTCIICQKKFDRKVEFKMHMKVHTANTAEPSRTKKFQCRKCFKCFALKKSLIRHMCMHNENNDDYWKECLECDMEFLCAEAYQEHLSVCHQFACSSCPQFIFNTVQELKVHMFEHELDQE